ncbi:MAG: hypothetical protein KC547_15510 [Anaerolineae bacterium]|nr:hypothetical protein [Anaerolineae bacterium]MCA9908915.1 hypothetical protein [Anaerolineae bacterium]
MARKTASPVEEVAERVETIEEKVDSAFDMFVEHQRKAFTEVSHAFNALLPEGVKEHGEKAVEEVIEGYRNLFNSALDDLIETLEKARLEKKAVAKKPLQRKN